MIYNKISGFSDEISSDTTIQFEALNKLGIKYFEPRGIDGKNISELSSSEIFSLAKKIKKYNLKVSSIGSPIGKIKISEDFSSHFEIFKKIIETAKILETKYIRIFSFYYTDKTPTSEERTEVFLRLKKMIDYAQENNIILLHENEKGIYGDTAIRCAELMKELYCDNFKAVFDPANFVQCKQDTIKSFSMLQPYIEYMHIKDALFTTGSVVPAGLGDGNIKYILKNLFENGYNGFLSLEPHLGNFEGLATLENSDIMNNLPQGGEGTFILAYKSLKKILTEI